MPATAGDLQDSVLAWTGHQGTLSALEEKIAATGDPVHAEELTLCFAVTRELGIAYRRWEVVMARFLEGTDATD